MKYKHFDKKIKDSTIDALDLLMHYVSIIDHGLEVAMESGDLEKYETFSDRMLGASDRLTSIVMNFGEEEEQNEQSEKRAIGFEFKNNPDPTEPSEGILPPNSEPG